MYGTQPHDNLSSMQQSSCHHARQCPPKILMPHRPHCRLHLPHGYQEFQNAPALGARHWECARGDSLKAHPLAP